LEKVLELMPSMICYDSSVAMQRYLAAIKHMMNRNFPELADVLRRHMKDVAALVLPPENPISQIYVVMAEVDSKDVDAVLDKAWECRNDSLTPHFGPFSFDVIGSKIDFINRVYWKYPKEAENRLRILLFEYEDRCGQTSSCTLNVMSEMAFNLLQQKRAMEGETISNDMLGRARRSKSFVYEVIVFELLAETQHASGNLWTACANLSVAMDMVEQGRGRDDPWRMRYLLRLEKWLREGAWR
jgi:hypothetical protein